uniref:DDE Tnp4 domain-containing protein n=1 Tax=Dunaliella tertiolecta TaxID=3047 RepID=A0A7S3R5Z0_DUNTE
MRIEKPYHWGDVYYYFMKHMAIILFVCVDAHGNFTFVSAGGAGQVGDAHTWNCSALRAKIDYGSWLALPPNARMEEMTIDGTVFKPYICAESAFALTPNPTK